MKTTFTRSNWRILGYSFLVMVMAIMTMSLTFVYPANDDIPSISPIKAGEYDKITSGFGMRIHPVSKKERFHTGIDFKATVGTEIIATADGEVSKVAFQKRGYGKMLIINHGNGYETWYTQMSDYAVSQGEKVKKGQVIGYVGSSGLSDEPHLHYEVHKAGKPVNPQDYIKD